MKKTRWYLNPILVMVFSVIALGTSLFLYIYWYLEVSTGLATLASRFNFDPTTGSRSEDLGGYPGVIPAGGYHPDGDIHYLYI